MGGDVKVNVYFSRFGDCFCCCTCGSTLTQREEFLVHPLLKSKLFRGKVPISCGNAGEAVRNPFRGMELKP